MIERMEKMNIIYKIASIALFIIITHFAYAQEITVKPNKIEDLKKKTRKDLINLAIKYINDPDFKQINYDRIKVMASATKMYVVFDASVRYVPVLTSYYAPVYVDLVNPKVSIKEVSNSGFFSTIFYESGTLYKNQIKSILGTIAKSKDSYILPNGVVTDSMFVNIKEVYGHYDVEINSEKATYTCKVEKVGAKVYDVAKSEGVRSPIFGSKSFTEIK
jgi:hypothetical protein